MSNTGKQRIDRDFLSIADQHYDDDDNDPNADSDCCWSSADLILGTGDDKEIATVLACMMAARHWMVRAVERQAFRT